MLPQYCVCLGQCFSAVLLASIQRYTTEEDKKREQTREDLTTVVSFSFPVSNEEREFRERERKKERERGEL